MRRWLTRSSWCTRSRQSAAHGWLRSLSGTAKFITARLLKDSNVGRFSSSPPWTANRRTLAAYCGNGVYLDMGLLDHRAHRACSGAVAAKWADPPDTPTSARWSFLASDSHHGHTATAIDHSAGIGSMVLAIAIAGYAFYGNSSETFLYRLGIIVDVVAFFSGCILARSAVAEYLAVTMAIVMGKPLYVVGSKPTRPPQ